MNDIQALKLAVEKLHGGKATHVDTVRVCETFRGKTVWEGEVEVFDLTGVEAAKQCYAWHHKEHNSKRTRLVAVLAVPPINSPLAAVRAAIVSDLKKERAN